MRQGFVKVAAATPDIRVADVDYNTEQICRMMDEAAGEGAKIHRVPGALYYRLYLQRLIYPGGAA